MSLWTASASTMQDLHPEVELTPPPRANPLVQPRLMSSAQDDIAFHRPFSLPRTSTFPKGPPPPIKESKTRRESYNLSGSTFLITNTGRTLKLPMPSDSRADPLNWTQWKTAGAMFAIAFYSIVCLCAALAASAILGPIEEGFRDQDIAPWLVKAIISAPTLFMGIGCFLWVPLSIGMGRRPTILIATVVVLLALIWASNAPTFSQLVGAVCFLGLGEGLSLALVLLMIIDMTYINQRPRAIALMWSVGGFFGTTGAAVVSVIAKNTGNWRSFYQYWMIPVSCSLVLTFFFYPETYFKRPTVAFDGLIILQSATEKLTIYKDIEANSDIYRDLPEPPVRSGFAGLRDKLGLSRSPFSSWPGAWRCFIQMWYCATNPLIFWVFLASAFNSAAMIYIGATYARVLIAPPYNISSDVVGTINIAAGVGALCGFPVWHFVICKIVVRFSKRNNGVLEAEHYLVGYIVPIVTGSISSLLYGLAVGYQWDPWVYFLAYGLNGFSFVTLMIANTLWVAEAFPRWAAPALAVVGGGCYLVSFAMSFTLVPWIEAHGFKWVGIELTILQIVGGLVAMPVAFWGKSARQAIQGRWADDRSGALRPI